MTKQDYIIAELELQRNNALNTSVLLSADLSLAKERIADLERQLAEKAVSTEEKVLP